ncbi:hypothetical protein ACFQLX_14060 [Streptomyces polyrhachis]|uniref:Integral membrane protein n=1 Tax=Streptomyces polyrhachis TaxID=1282885 RepID=A0ABW2GJR1_9ACTN
MSSQPQPGVIRATAALGRDLSGPVAVLSAVIAGICLAVGLVMSGAALAGHVFGAWRSPTSLTPGLIGAAMVGVAPGLFTVGWARMWEEARTLVIPTAIVLTGLFGVSVFNAGELQIANGAAILVAVFSLGWLAVLGLLAPVAMGCVLLQLRSPREVPPAGAPVPLPPWSRPLLSLVGSAWFGLGAGLLFLPGYWGALLPWQANRADAQGLGVWAVAIGTGVLGALVENDLERVRPALIALPGIALATGVVLAVHAQDVDWITGPGAAVAGLVAALAACGVVGEWLRRRGS